MEFLATLPGWAITGIVCGVLGGLAGLLGGVLQKTGFAWGRFVTVIGIVAGLQLSQHGLVDWVRNQGVTPATAATTLKAENPQMFGFLETAFPNDFAMLTTTIANEVKGGASAAQIRQTAFDAMASIRRKYAPMVGLASDADQAAIIDETIRFHQAALDKDWQLCNAIAEQGPAVLNNRTGVDDLIAMVQPQGVLMLQAAANAMTTPTQRRAATDVDWGVVGEEMAARGVTEAQLDAMANLDVSSPELCPAIILLMQTLNSVDSEPIKVVRAGYLVDASGS